MSLAQSYYNEEQKQDRQHSRDRDGPITCWLRWHNRQRNGKTVRRQVESTPMVSRLVSTPEAVYIGASNMPSHGGI